MANVWTAGGEHVWLGAVHPRVGAAHRYRCDVLQLPGGPVEFRDPVAARAIDHVLVERLGRHVPVFDDPNRMPAALGDLAVVAAAGNAHRAALLLPGAHAIGKTRRDAHVEELRGGLVEPGTPALAAVHGHEGSLVADQRDDARVVRVDPQDLVVIPARRT